MDHDEVIWNGTWKTALRARRVQEQPMFEMRSAGFGAFAARVAVGRLGSRAPTLAAPGLKELQHYAALPDIEVAAERVAVAIVRGETITLFVDYDTDGSTAGAILSEALVALFGADGGRVKVMMGHRLRDGYGLTDAVVDRILDDVPRARLVITADCGSADEARIKRLKDNGIDTVVLDHHEIPSQNPPKSAFAFVSPKREDSGYDANVAGCMVAFLLMAAVKQVLKRDHRVNDQACDLRGILEFAALGSLADCVDIGSSPTNRCVIRSGLRRINAGTRACWRVAAQRMGQHSIVRMTSTDLIFGVVPRINAHSRIDEPMPGYHYLMAANDIEAGRWFDLLDAANIERKGIERQMVEAAMGIAAQQVGEGASGLVIWLEDGHPGVQGIVASRLVERWSRPTVCLSPHTLQADLCQGSVRSVKGYSVSEGLDWIRTHKGVLLAGGGHAMAGGVTLAREAVDRFRALFQEHTRRVLQGTTVVNAIEHDGPLTCADLTAALLDELATVEPYGQGFPRPVFVIEDALVENLRVVGKDGVHLKLILSQAGTRAEAIWFYAREGAQDPLPVSVGTRRSFAIEPSANWYRGQAKVQARILGAIIER